MKKVLGSNDYENIGEEVLKDHKKYKKCEIGDEYNSKICTINEEKGTYMIKICYVGNELYMVWIEILDEKERKELSKYCTCSICDYERYIMKYDHCNILHAVIYIAFNFGCRKEISCLKQDSNISQYRINSSRERKEKIEKKDK